MWIRDEDPFIGKYFEQTGDKFEIEHLTEALKFAKDFSIAIDGGGHYGSWTRYLAKHFQQVHTFEPVAETFNCLEKNTEGLNNVALYQQALGAFPGSVTVAPGKMYSHPGMETIIGTGSTPLITIDSLQLPSLGFLKLDIEGYELFALQGATRTLRHYKPIVILEENIRGQLEHGVPEGACKQFLETLGAKLTLKIGMDYIFTW